MAPNFSSMLRKPAGQAKKPDALPVGDYPGIVKSYEVHDKNKNKTVQVDYQVAYLGWPESVSDDQRVVTSDDGTQRSIDLSKRQSRKAFYIFNQDGSEADDLWKLDEFLRSCGIEPKGRSYEELIPEAVGKRVIAPVTQKYDEGKNETFNNIGKLVGDPS